MLCSVKVGDFGVNCRGTPMLGMEVRCLEKLDGQ